MSLPSFESRPGGSSDGPFGSAFSVRSPSVTSHHGAVSCPVGGPRGSALQVCLPKCPPSVASRRSAVVCTVEAFLAVSYMFTCALAICRVESQHRVVPGRGTFHLSFVYVLAFCCVASWHLVMPSQCHFGSALHVHSPLSHLIAAAYCARSGHALASPASSCDTCHTRACLHPKHCVELARVAEGATTVKLDASERWAEGKDGGGLQGGTGAGMLVSDWMLEAPQPQKDAVGCRRGRGFDAPGCRCGCDIEGAGDD